MSFYFFASNTKSLLSLAKGYEKSNSYMGRHIYLDNIVTPLEENLLNYKLYLLIVGPVKVSSVEIEMCDI